jgi:flagellar hook-associated protein 2
MATVSSTNFLTSLGAGSGVDTKSLAQNLADAEINPRKEAINTKITKTEARISGIGYIKAALGDLKTAFAKLDDASEFASITPSNTQPSALGVTTTAGAQTGTYALEVAQLARAQRTASNGLAGRDTSLNAGQSFTLNLSVNSGPANTITVATDTPTGVVNAINAANLGVKAQLLQTGDPANPFTMVVSGESGAAKNFSLTASGGQINFSNHLQTAADARLKVNGLEVTRSNNQINDLIDGVSLDLYATTTSPARIDLKRETSTIKENLKNLVTSYNDLDTTLLELGNVKSAIKDVGGSLAGDSMLQSIRMQVRGYITNLASTPGSTLKAARDVGLSFDRNGKLTLDEAKLDRTLQNNFDDVAKIFTAGTDNKSLFSMAPAGIAGDAVARLDRILRSTGQLTVQTDNANKQISVYKADLTKLDARLTLLLDRYTKQFSAMDSIVGSNNSLKTSLKSSFDGMMSIYTNK